MKEAKIFEAMQEMEKQGFTLAQALAVLQAQAQAEKNARLAWTVATYNVIHDETMDNATKVALMLEMMEDDTMNRKARANDYGRIGDLIETNVCAFLRGDTMKARDVHVKAAGRKDMTYKGYTLEIGSNGKTFSTRDPERFEPSFKETGWNINDVLSDKVDFFVYGVRAGQIAEEAAYAEKLYVFTRDQLAAFFEKSGLHGLKTNLHTTKNGYALTVQYTEGYANRFDKWVEANNIPTLATFKAMMEE